MTTRRRLLCTPLLMASCATPPSPPPAATPIDLPPGQHGLNIHLDGIEAPARLWLQLPPGYAGAREPWPLLFFLHGSGERGRDLDRVKVHGPPRHAAAGTAYPCVLASPQLDDGRRWDTTWLHALRATLLARLHADPARVCATGLSLGGHGVWDWASAFPDDLAAIAPVCGHGRPADVCRARSVPVRAYHGDADPVVPIERQRECVEALRACGGSVDFVVYAGVGHDSWMAAYSDPQLLPWLLAQRRNR